MKKICFAFFLVCISIIASHKESFAQLSFIVDQTSFASLPLDGGVVGIDIFDINQDGNLDLLSVGDHGSPNVNTPQHGITVWFGNGTGTGWLLYQNGNFGYGGICAGDLNNDGYMDVAYGIHHNYSSTDFGDQLLEAALGDGTGMNWTPWDDSLATAGETYGMFGTDMGDIDNDGLLDIGSTSFGCCAGYHVYRNLGTGTWHHSYGYVGGNASERFLFGDINHDGKLDFAATHQNGTPFFGDGAGNFTNQHLNLPVQPTLGFYDISLGDVDNDGDDELAFTMNSGVYVYRFNTITQQWNNISGALPTSGSYSGVRFYDVDHDGFLDIVTASGNTITIWLGDGGNSWTSTYTVSVAGMSYARDMAIADVTHDGKPEIFIWGQFQLSPFTYVNRLYVLRDTAAAVDLFIHPTLPRSTECYPPLSIRFIQWQSSVPNFHASAVTLELSSTGPSGPFTTIASGIPNNGTYQWTVPTLSSANCYIRYILVDNVTLQADTALSQNAFSIDCDIPTGAIQNRNDEARFYVYPNPANEWIAVSGEAGNDARVTITLLDLSGREVKVWKKQSDAAGKKYLDRLDIKSTAQGIYFLNIKTDKGTWTEKLSIVK